MLLLPLSWLLPLFASAPTEGPSPVTVITSEMLRACGCRTLEDALTTYVPGMLPVSATDERNLSVRGLYGPSQQQILVLIDGHRLNQRAYLAAPPGYGISVNPDKVAEIRVHRGPGPAIYGNPGLAAVVDLVTKSGREIGGATLRFGAGSDSAWGGELAAGTDLGPGHDLVLYGQIFRTSGQAVSISAADDLIVDPTAEMPRAGTIDVGRTSDPYNHDLGLRYRWNDFTLTAIHRIEKSSELFTGGGRTGDLFDASRIRSFQGTGPGLALENMHAGLGWTKPAGGGLAFDVGLGLDHSNGSGVFVTSPMNDAMLIDWRDHAYYAAASATYDYEAAFLGRGRLAVGLSADLFWLVDSNLLTQSGDNWTGAGDRPNRKVILQGHEATYSAFAELTQDLGDVLSVDLGGRVDAKQRRRQPDGDPTDPEPTRPADYALFSPRAGVTCRPADWLDLKISAADAFAEAPYWYRYNALPAYAGATALVPQRNRVFQLTQTLRLLDGELTSTLNLSYSRLRDLIDRVRYDNSAELDPLALEEELAWGRSWLRVRGNFTALYVAHAEHYFAFEGSHRVWNVPALFGNLVASAKLFSDAWLDVHLRYLGGYPAPIMRVSLNRPDLSANFLNQEGAVLLADAGVRFKNVGIAGLGLGIHVDNLFDTRWSLGGTTPFPYPQRGRWVFATIEYTLVSAP